MKKTILLACLVIPTFIFGQKPMSKTEVWKMEARQERARKEAVLINKSPGDHLLSASKNFKLGLISSIGGGTIATAMILIGQGENVTQDAQDELNTVAYVVGAASIIAGTIFTVKGIIDLGKAGKRLNYEVGVTEAKLAFVF